MPREDNTEETDDSRRSFMKKGALASSAVALGLASSGSTGAQENAQEPNTGLVFVDSYKPGVGFQLVSRLQQPTVEGILGYVDPANPGQSSGAVVDPDDWNGYIINYQGCGPGNYEMIFLREGLLEQGTTYSFTTNAVFFSNQLGLLESEIQQGTGGGGGGNGGGGGGGNMTSP
ncbi:hypothetical protein [Halorussus pelagicus]|uniref:hypothetical protein n=1 Tax=Halorussus pelagicus TaxID=2505977 RepID=UPI000FFC408D|nr:hypothetical protein [Halorussus pelagicus]